MKTVDVVIATPSMLLPHDPSDYPVIKYVAVAGEPCPKGKSYLPDIDRSFNLIDSSGRVMGLQSQILQLLWPHRGMLDFQVFPISILTV